MGPKTSKIPESASREMKRKIHGKFNPKERIRIILDGLKGEDSIAALCRREGIAFRSICKTIPISKYL